MTDEEFDVIRCRLDLLGEALGEILPPDAAKRLQEDWVQANGLKWDDTTGRWYRPVSGESAQS